MNVRRTPRHDTDYWYAIAILQSQLPRLRSGLPWAYFITFACYGNRLHGDSRGSVDRLHNGYRSRLLDASLPRQAYEARLMSDEPRTLDETARGIVLDAIRQVCRHKNWRAYAIHVRVTHVHAVVQAGAAPARFLGVFKAYSSRALNERLGYCAKRWSRHGSVRWLWSPTEVDAAIDYVLQRQGEPMAVHEHANRWSDLL